jgi:hypothetical protein
VAITDFYEKMVLMERKVVNDGMGAYEEVWADGVIFYGGINTDLSIETRIAEQQGLKSLYTITVDKNFPLAQHDVIRLANGKIVRVTNDPNDIQTPAMADISFKQASAEKWEI